MELGTAGTRIDLNRQHSLAVVLFQLGGPDSLAAVEPFLHNLFSDPDIFDFPTARLARPLLARVISSRRAEKVQHHYARIGGKSPIADLTRRQAQALERELGTHIDARVFVAMRYWHPLTRQAVEEIASEHFEEVVLLPLYPQFSKTTSGSSLNEWSRHQHLLPRTLPVATVPAFYNQPLYLNAMVECISQGLDRVRNRLASDGRSLGPSHDHSKIHLLFSAHGLPLHVIEGGDPYQKQIESTVELLTERGGWPYPHALCYQSRVAPGRWLGPSLESTIERLGREGVRSVLVIPVSFVTDHIETLYEINIEAREHAAQAGIEHFELMPALNDSPKFIAALADLVLRNSRLLADLEATAASRT